MNSCLHFFLLNILLHSEIHPITEVEKVGLSWFGCILLINRCCVVHNQKQLPTHMHCEIKIYVFSTHLLQRSINVVRFKCNVLWRLFSCAMSCVNVGQSHSNVFTTYFHNYQCWNKISSSAGCYLCSTVLLISVTWSCLSLQ